MGKKNHFSNAKPLSDEPVYRNHWEIQFNRVEGKYGSRSSVATYHMVFTSESALNLHLHSGNVLEVGLILADVRDVQMLSEFDNKLINEMVMCLADPVGNIIKKHVYDFKSFDMLRHDVRSGFHNYKWSGEITSSTITTIF